MQIDSKNFLKKLEYILEENRNPVFAIQMEAYMRNQFQFLGIKAPLRKELLNPFLIKSKRPQIEEINYIVKTMWDNPYREFQFCAMDLTIKYNKGLGPEFFLLFEHMITKKSWWDTVDFIASNLVGNLIKHYPDEGIKQIDKWRKSENLWLVRTCIIFQLKYKSEVDEQLLFSIIEENHAHPDFFIRKAIGWALRQYAKFNPTNVLNFVNEHELSGLSKREALKHLN